MPNASTSDQKTDTTTHTGEFAQLERTAKDHTKSGVAVSHVCAFTRCMRKLCLQYVTNTYLWSDLYIPSTLSLRVFRSVSTLHNSLINYHHERNSTNGVRLLVLRK